jgi:hypothetical protein
MAESPRFFISFAENDTGYVRPLLDFLTPHLRASRAFAYKTWEFHELLVGESWHDRIQDEIDHCDFGFLCISPAFLASDYITRHELPRFVGREGKPILPIGLKPIDFKLHDLKGLEAHQLFRLGRKSFYSDLRTTERREAFAFELFRQIEFRLSRLIAAC